MAASPAVVELGIADIHRAMCAGTLSARALVDVYRARIVAYYQHGPALNAVVCVDEQAATKADALDRVFADRGELSGPLHGTVPLVKDNIDVAGLPSSSGVAAPRRT